jgi:methionyl-tRNA formyltransferase
MKLILFSHFHIDAYELAMAWARRNGHVVKLLVTSPGPSAVRSKAYQEIIAAAPPEQEILVTTRVRRLAGYLAPLKPDLILMCGWWYRMPPDVITLPRLGTFNLHAAYLPRYRGPNVPTRAIYDGQPLGATLHRVDPEIDTGPILYRTQAPLPDDLSPGNVWNNLLSLATEALEEGLARAIAGEQGETQDDSEASYAAPFSEEEKWLDWDRRSLMLYRQAAALNMAGPQARAQIEGQPVVVERLDRLDAERPDCPIGTVLDRDGEIAIVVVQDGVVRVGTKPMSA